MLRPICCAALFCITGMPGVGQATSPAAPEPLNNPADVFAAAAPFYDFNDPSLKPWHLKATYQLFDDKGKPAEQGTYEYWWASPKVNRSTWTRAGATRTDWVTADGKYSFLATGETLKYFEGELKSALFAPLPRAVDLDAARVRLDVQSVPLGGSKISCIMLVPRGMPHDSTQVIPLGLFPT